MPKTLWVLRKKANKMYIILLYINITILKLCCKNWTETNFTNACTPWYVTLFSIKGILELTKKKRFALGKYKLIDVIVNEGKGENLSYNFFSNQWSVCHTQPFRGINNTNNRIASIRQGVILKIGFTTHKQESLKKTAVLHHKITVTKG